MIILSNGVMRVGWQASGHSGAGEEPEPGHGLLGRGAPGGPPLGRDLRLAGFVKDAEWDTCPPSAALADALEAASGPEWRCPGATRDEMIGLLRRWQAVESWAAAGKLGVLRALIRDDDEPLPGGGYPDHRERPHHPAHPASRRGPSPAPTIRARQAATAPGPSPCPAAGASP
jgi:hypothetical protein